MGAIIFPAVIVFSTPVVRVLTVNHRTVNHRIFERRSPLDLCIYSYSKHTFLVARYLVILPVLGKATAGKPIITYLCAHSTTLFRGVLRGVLRERFTLIFLGLLT